MCMIFAHVGLAGAVVATDRRGWVGGDTYRDLGGKLVATATGWATAAGGAAVGAAGLIALRDAPASEAPGDTLRTALHLGGFPMDRQPDENGIDLDAAHFLIAEATPAGLAVYSYHNATGGPTRGSLSLPPMGLSADRRSELVRGLYGAVDQELSPRLLLGHCAARMAGCFAALADVAPAMSPDVEMGLIYPDGRRAFLRGMARDIASAPALDAFLAPWPTLTFAETEALAP